MQDYEIVIGGSKTGSDAAVTFSTCACLICSGGSKDKGDIAANHHLNGIAVRPEIATALKLGSIDSVISAGNEIDVFSVTLEAGKTYIFSLFGKGPNPLTDAYLLLANAAGDVILAQDDDGGAERNSLITFTATQSGTYLLGATGFDETATGNYQLDVVQQVAPDIPVARTAATIAAAPTLAIDGVTYGFIEASVPGNYQTSGVVLGEVDSYRLEATAGRVYTIELAGGADGTSDPFALPPGELDTFLVIRRVNADGTSSTIVPSLISDDISFPSDISSRVSFYADQNATYLVEAMSYRPWTGGYSITVEEQTLADLDPLDSIDWRSAENVAPKPGDAKVKVYFAEAGDSLGELNDAGTGPRESFGWNDYEKQQVMEALKEFTKITGLQYEITTAKSEATFKLMTTTSNDFGAFFYPQDPAFGTQRGIGAFNVDNGGWSFDQQQGLLKGGFDFAVVLHEFGHAHGLAHPHDRGGGSDILPGVTGPSGSLGVFNLNQGVYTVMSYNDAWQLHPDGPSPLTAAGVDNGWSGTLSAFDIAALQKRYGLHDHATGNTVYELKDVQARGTFYETIWDTGGTDEIRYNGNRAARIDLLAATIDYTPTGGGVVSFVDDIKGGYTIANGVVIENATGGGGNDVLIGNAAANILTGNGGDDWLMGRGGADLHRGGAGFDTASYRDSAAGVVASLGGGGSSGDAAGDRYDSIEALEGSNFADELNGGNGTDTLIGLGGNDRLIGGNASDTLNGGDGDDFLDGGNDNDTLDGGAGSDTLRGENGNDILNGGAGADLVDGANGNDVLDGGADADIVRGGNGNDVIGGGAGNDVLEGDNGNDRINGGAGNDTYSGGNGNDVFVIGDLGGVDVFTDFRRGQDKVDLSSLDAVAGGDDNAFTFAGNAFSGVAGQLIAFTSGGSHFFAGDVNGDGVADFTVMTNVLLTGSDFTF